MERENLYNYIELAKTDPQKALSKFSDWIDNHTNWIADFMLYGNFTDCQSIVSRPEDDYYDNLDYFRDAVEEPNIDELTPDDIDSLQGMIDAYHLYHMWHGKPVWLNRNNAPVSSDEAIEAIKETGATINRSNLHSEPKHDPLEDHSHTTHAIFCYKTPAQLKQERQQANARQQEIQTEKRKMAGIKKHIRKLRK